MEYYEFMLLNSGPLVWNMVMFVVMNLLIIFHDEFGIYEFMYMI